MNLIKKNILYNKKKKNVHTVIGLYPICFKCLNLVCNKPVGRSVVVKTRFVANTTAYHSLPFFGAYLISPKGICDNCSFEDTYLLVTGS